MSKELHCARCGALGYEPEVPILWQHQKHPIIQVYYIPKALPTARRRPRVDECHIYPLCANCALTVNSIINNLMYKGACEENTPVPSTTG